MWPGDPRTRNSTSVHSPTHYWFALFCGSAPSEPVQLPTALATVTCLLLWELREGTARSAVGVGCIRRGRGTPHQSQSGRSHRISNTAAPGRSHWRDSYEARVMAGMLACSTSGRHLAQRSSTTLECGWGKQCRNANTSDCSLKRIRCTSTTVPG